MPGSDRTLALRLSLFYGAYFVVMGVQLPFWPTWLESRGVSSVEIGVLVSVGVWARAVSNPLFAHHADRSGERRRPMLWLAWGSALVFALFFVPGGFWWLLLVSAAFGLLYAPLLALGESTTLLSGIASGVDYGRVRLWGSLTFIGAATLGGYALEGAAPDLVPWLMLALLLGLVGVCHALPDERPPERHTAARGPLRELLGRPVFVVFLVAAALCQASHALYYGFATLHWKAAGHAEGTIGWLWAEGVIAEIVLFAVGAHLTRRFGAVELILVGAVAGVVRWLATAASSDLLVLCSVQPLHALTYGAAHLGAMRFLAETVSSSMSATAQSLYAGVANGVAMGLALLLSGWLYEAYGGQAFVAMAVLSGLGGVAAMGILLCRRRGERLRVDGHG